MKILACYPMSHSQNGGMILGIVQWVGWDGLYAIRFRGLRGLTAGTLPQRRRSGCQYSGGRLGIDEPSRRKFQNSHALVNR
jgi:hypothetical protein